MAAKDETKPDVELQEESHLRVSSDGKVSLSKVAVQVAPAIAQFSEQEQRKIVRRIDIRIIPILSAVYTVALIDRANLGIASIAGMGEDLELSVGMRYSIATLAMFVTYIIFELPSTVLLRVMGPRIVLSFVTMSWCVTLIGFGFVKNWHALTGMRALLIVALLSLKLWRANKGQAMGTVIIEGQEGFRYTL
ncbi:hypothetical protein AYO21_10374 [Fonsecaea monophora]|uniref:Major facilitator superfamily (MFS) profile domain-containing protein n=1 Tax=Fonsecaea monophora TaxID=254056 RepID=A0A177ETT0_9EURO|nr:hypothetical protein AYO21_10374 [Fonsecaea monophora]OAG35424.1 hypothetical protein AYO21_10374 [Fonsecaea monophora]